MTANMKRTMHIAVAVPAALMMATACGAADGALTGGDGGTVTETAGDGNGGSGNGGDGCGTQTAEQAMNANIGSVPPPPTGGGWRYVQDDYDTCSDLTYIWLEQAPQRTSRFATKLMFFHDGEYLGVDTDSPQQVQSISGDGSRLTVVYRDWEKMQEDGAANAEAATYNTEVTYYWDGGKVAYEGRIPGDG